jgi:hypothetical protein
MVKKCVALIRCYRGIFPEGWLAMLNCSGYILLFLLDGWLRGEVLALDEKGLLEFREQMIWNRTRAKISLK